VKITFSDLWRTSGTVDRGTYALVGLVGFAIKHNLDRLLATYGFHRPWGIFNYWIAPGDIVRVTQLGGSDARFLAMLVALALPFIWVGLALTVKRLRSVGWPTALVILFFVPFLNLLFFLLLCLVPERTPDQRQDSPSRNSHLTHFLPESAIGSAALSLLLTVPAGYGMVVFGTLYLANYGWGLFVAVPFTMGFVAAWIYELRRPQTAFGDIVVALFSVSLLGLALFALAAEGGICLLMIMPLALPLAAFGGAFAHAVRKGWRKEAPAMMGALILLAPGVQWIEHAVAARPPVYEVRTAIDVQAPPEVVWQQVVAFTEIPPPTELIFRAGIAYPIRAEMLGSGVGAERHCVFSTGSFVEPIQIWNPPRQLKFSVSSNPPPLEEWSPYSHIEPPHLHGYLMSEGGQFLLTPLAGGGTRLEGTTWYQHGLWPAAYWRLWSDAVIHRIHLRVLRHIQEEAEKKSAQ
jgi:uncharacterized membrane protein YhaH (DUF805 family)